MSMRVSRQSEHYASDQSLDQSIQAEAHRVAAESFSFGHLLSGPSIGRQGSDPLDL